MKHNGLFWIGIMVILFSSCNQDGKEIASNNTTSSSPSNWKNYKSPDLTLKYPLSWIISVDTSEGEIFHVSRPEQKELGVVGYDISISYFQKESEFREFVNDQVTFLKENYSVKIQKEDQTAFDSKNSFRYIIAFPTDAGKSETADIMYVEGAEQYYQIFAAGMSKYKPQADSIIRTIQLH